MVADNQQVELNLRDYLSILRRRRRALTLIVLLVVGCSLAYSLLQTPVYAGKAEVLLQPRATETLFDPNTGQARDATRVVQTEIRVLKSQPVRQAVRAQVGSAPKVAAAPVGQTDVIQVVVESTDPERAALLANAYVRSYIEFRRKQTVDDLLAAGGQIRTKIDDLQREIDTASGTTQENLIQQQALFREKLDELDVAGSLQTGGAQLVEPATTPTTPVKPRPLRTAALALALGLMLGVGVAFLLDYLDDSVKAKEDLERAIPGVAVVGLIPSVSSWKDKERPQVVSVTEPTSPTAEAYRTLRTAVQFMGLDRPVRSVQLTSPSAQEGKTTTLANLGVALAKAGNRVVLVCCDLRRPRIHEFFGLSNAIGFTSVLLGEVPLSGALQDVPGVDRLQVLASGPLPPNPSELLSSRRALEVLGPLQAEGKIVLVDSPPVLPVTDSLVLSRHVDATLLVCAAGRTSRKEAARAVELLEQVDAPLAGAVLNGVSAEGSYGYTYEYYSQAPVAAPQGAPDGERRRARQSSDFV